MNEKILVTGIAGFIGSHLARTMLDRGYEVWGIDDFSTGIADNVPANAQFIKGDCASMAVIKQLGNVAFKAVFHIAGQSSGEISFDDPARDLDCNTRSTVILMNYCVRTGCHRFLYSSSMSVYGRPDACPVAETHPCRPISFYGARKLASEHYMRICGQSGLHTTALRLFNVYGPGQNMANLRQGMVSIYLAQLLSRDDIVVKGGLDRFRDFVFIDDVVDAFLLCMDDQRSFGRIYNVATGVKTTVAELLETLMRVANLRKEVIVSAGTPGDQGGIYADVAMIKAELGFSARTALAEGLEATVRWAKAGQ